MQNQPGTNHNPKGKYMDDYLKNIESETWKKYCQGFNTESHPENPMYKRELEELEDIYKSTLKSVKRDMEDIMPELLDVLERFFSIGNQEKLLNEKLDLLLFKLGKNEEG